MTRVLEKKCWKIFLQGSGLGHSYSMSLWIILSILWRHYDLLKYADENTVSVIRNIVHFVISALKKDAKYAVLCFTDNFMQANSNKIQIYVHDKVYK